MIPRPSGLGTVRAILILAALDVAVFGGVLGHELLTWDDLAVTVQNPYLNPPSVGGVLALWRRPWMDMYMPVTYSTWGILAFLAGGFDPVVFHAASLGIHVLCGLVAFGLLRPIVRDDRAAVAGALLFGLHPVQVESVCWMGGMNDLLCGLFSLLALERYLEFARGRRTVSYALATLCWVLALLSKPSAVAVPLIAFALDRFVIQRPARDAARALTPWLLIAIAWILLTRSIQLAAQTATTPVWTRPFVCGDALFFYAAKLSWPLDLAHDYGRSPAWVISHAFGYATWVVPLAIGLLILSWRRRWPWIAAGASASVLAVSPVLGLVPFDFQRYSTVADHYLYLALLGPALALACALARSGVRRMWAAAWVVLALLGLRSRLQVPVWKDDFTLYLHTLEVNPRSWVSHGNLGVALDARGRSEEAIAEFQRALELEPADVRSRTNLGIVLDAEGRTAEAIPHFEEALRLRPEDALTHESLALALLKSDRPAEAIPHLRETLRIQPGNFGAHYEIAVALEATGELDLSIEHLREALRLNPPFRKAHKALETALELQTSRSRAR